MLWMFVHDLAAIEGGEALVVMLFCLKQVQLNINVGDGDEVLSVKAVCFYLSR